MSLPNFERLPSNRPLSRRSALCAAAAALAGCASLDPRHLTLSESELQALLERQFPRQQRVLEVLDVQLLAPRVQLRPERNRIATSLDLSAVERLGGRPMRGSLMLEHGLRYEPTDASLRLSNVRVDRFQLDVAGTALGGQAARLGGLLVERALDDFVVYRVGDERRRLLAQAGVNNAEVAVTSRGVELRFTSGR